MPALKWTEEKIRAEAAKYDTKAAFKRGSPKAYDRAQYYGLLDQLGLVSEKRAKPSKWTEVLLREKLATCSSKTEFRKTHGNGAMKAAAALGLHDEFFGKDRRVFLSDEEVLNIGRQFDTANAFKKGAYKVYQVACARGLRERLHFTPQKESWTDEKVRAVASQYSTYADFHSGNYAAYQAASLRGIIHDLGLVTRTGRYAGAADIVYVWRVVGKTFNGQPVYKIGITSSHRGDERIKRVAREAGFDFEVLFFENVGKGNAYRVERMLKRIGEHPGYEGIDGATEFRALSNQQLEVVLEILINNVQS